MDAAWQRILDKLSEKLQDDRFTHLQPYLEKLRNLCTVEQIRENTSPDFFSDLLDSFLKLGEEFQGDSSIEEASSYFQSRWNVNTVHQANRDIINLIFKDSNSSEKPTHLSPELIKVPIVLLVMNSDEAEELISLTAFQNCPKKISNKFSRLMKRLDREIPDWKMRYQSSPEAWLPFGSDQNRMNIKQFIAGALNLAKEKYEEKYEEAISFCPDFIDIRKINSKRRLLKELRQDGCVVIMDMISMCHPKISSSFQQSLLDAYPNTVAMNFVPIYSIIEETRKMAIREICISDLELFKRSNDSDEYGKCNEIYEENKFNQWLEYWIPKSIGEKMGNRRAKSKGMFNLINKFD